MDARENASLLMKPSQLAPGMTPLAGRWTERPVAQGILSAGLLAMAYPPVGAGWLGWFALVPLLLLVESAARPWRLYLAAWLGGLVFWLFSVEWIRRILPGAWPGWLVLAAYLSLYWPIALGLLRFAVRRFGMPLLIAAPIVFIGLEYARAFILGGFPWYYLAHTQAELPLLIQVSDLTGAWGVSWLVAMVNGWLVEVLTHPLLEWRGGARRLTWFQARRLIALGVLFASVLGYGAFRLHEEGTFRPGGKLALVQTNFPQGKPPIPTSFEILTAYRSLADQAIRDKPEAVIWPETAYPYGNIMIDETVPRAELERQFHVIDPDGKPSEWYEGRAEVRRQLKDWATYLQATTVFGLVSYDYSRGGPRKYNTAIVIEPRPDGAISSGASGSSRTTEEDRFEPWPMYHKMVLVPFGEYIPYLDFLPWLATLSPYQGGSLPNLNNGPGPSRFELAGMVAAPIICFEDTIPHVVNRYFQDGGPHPDVLLNLTNDGWYEDSAEHEVHLQNSVFRCVEHRTPMVRAVNTGITALIDGNGTIRAQLPKMKSGVLTVTVPLDGRRSVYSRTGDWLAAACLLIIISLFFLGLTRFGRPALQLE
jgi:apolipoprotein N-acyltransferase